MADLTAAFIDACVANILDHADELTALDQAIGDGDHGLNMKRGFEAIAAERDALSDLDPGAGLQKAGMTLVMKVGGASGPLYGSFLMAMGKAMPEESVSLDDFAQAFAAGVDAVKSRGKSDRGEKTMLDVLGPVEDALKQSASTADALAGATAAADEGLESTRAMQATKGRASFLAERSVDHLDPGARSSQLLVHAVCQVMQGKTGE
ncbi:MAG: dihydroxyacetone kinase subunit DhaL [Pseudomonadota bacterium]